MKRIITVFSVCSTLFYSSVAQDTTTAAVVTGTDSSLSPAISMSNNSGAGKNSRVTNQTALPRGTSPYKTSFKVDGPVIAAGIGLTYLGTTLIKNKRDFTMAEVMNKKKENLPFFDRGNAGYYSKKANDDSYIPFHASFVMPVVMALANGNERSKLGQVLVLYVETMAVTGTLFTMATGNVYRSRPYVYENYNNGANMEMRMDRDSHRSFYAGHTAASASATFFMAKVFSDFNPDSKAKPYVWALAAAVPAVVGYGRYKAGYHFLSDNVLGYTIGAAAGILIPQLHKTKVGQNISFVPQVGADYRGFALTYHIK